MSLNVIVLAAGLSRRMGSLNKLLLPFRDKTILETTIEHILAAHIGDIVVVVGHESEKIKPILQKYPLLRIVENFDFELGMTSSIQTGMRTTQNPSQGYMICLSDMVLIEPNEYRFLADQFFNFYALDKQTIVQPMFQNHSGNPVIFSHFYQKDILHTSDTEGCRSVVQKYKKHLKWVDMPTSHVLQDVDRREDYEKLITDVTDGGLKM